MVCDNTVNDFRNKYCSYECQNIARKAIGITKEDLIESLEQFNTVQEVAKHFGLAKPTIRNWFDRYEIDYSKIVKTNQWT